MIEWTKTETLRRLRKAGRMARQAEGIKNLRTELGTRSVPAYVTGHLPTAAERNPEGDDLSDYWRFSDSVRFLPEQARQPGYVAHIYLSDPDNGWSGGELRNVITVWLGDDDHEPQLLHVPGGWAPRVEEINTAAK